MIFWSCFHSNGGMNLFSKPLLKMHLYSCEQAGGHFEWGSASFQSACCSAMLQKEIKISRALTGKHFTKCKAVHKTEERKDWRWEMCLKEEKVAWESPNRWLKAHLSARSGALPVSLVHWNKSVYAPGKTYGNNTTSSVCKDSCARYIPYLFWSINDEVATRIKWTLVQLTKITVS